jgi:hypothetical protein
MPKPPEIIPDNPEAIDFEKLENIVIALDFLRGCAATTGVDDIKTMIDSTFKLILSTYTVVLRYHCENDASPEKIQ